MPVTPLHFGVLAPINHVKPKTVSLLTFAIVNVLIDLEAFFVIVLGMPGHYPIHGPATHSFLGATTIALVVSAFFVFSKRRRYYFYGAMLGGLSHVFLDMFCHAEMSPLFPLTHSNPFYFSSGLTMVSYLMMLLLVWWLYQARRGYYLDRVK